MYWELHNPFSRSAACTDSWQLLDICQASGLVKHLSRLIGDDIVLFDSQILPNPALPGVQPDGWHNDTLHFPLDGAGGFTIRLPFGEPGPRVMECRGSDAPVVEVEYAPGEILIHSAELEYRVPTKQRRTGSEYVVRYFSARRRYIRDRDHPAQIALTERFPWINYAKLPLWLVSGSDRADNDFVTGFSARVGRWTGAKAAI